jgi:hypothetical protein
LFGWDSVETDEFLRGRRRVAAELAFRIAGSGIKRRLQDDGAAEFWL